MNFRDPASIPLPQTDDEFERLCLLIARERYGAEYYRYGRRGQKQDGIDIYSAYYKGRYLQCKLYKKKVAPKFVIKVIKEDLELAKIKFTDLKQFIFAVSIDADTKIQDSCKQLSDENITVTPLFWNQMQEEIARSKWLLRYYLNCFPGAQWVSDDFISEEAAKGTQRNWQPIDFYSSNQFTQWYGIIKKWDASRVSYSNICEAIKISFENKFGDMPVAALVKGEGGSGKSVLLRRLAHDLREDYSVYWIADNANAFLENEWQYDIENNSNENYLLVLEDWYRNISKTEDKITANKLIQKVRSKSNVRLLIGDRPKTQIYYPTSKSNTFYFNASENESIFLQIVNEMPQWENKFPTVQRAKLLEFGLFQTLFTYQYLDEIPPSEKAENYFIELIQSDCNQLVNRENPFFKGLALSIKFYATVYSNYTINFTEDTLIYLSEKLSGVSRPYGWKLYKDLIVSRYFDNIEDEQSDTRLRFLRFIHDTVADQGWISVDINHPFSDDKEIVLLELMDYLKSRGNNHELSYVLYSVLKHKLCFISKEKLCSYLDHLIALKTQSPFYFRILFSSKPIEFFKWEIEEQKGYLNKMVGISNENGACWIAPLGFIKRSFNLKEQLAYIEQLIKAGNKCQFIVEAYYLLLPKERLKQTLAFHFNVKSLSEKSYQNLAAEVFRKLKDNEDVQNLIESYLLTDEPWLVKDTFNACLRIANNKIIAKQKAREYLKLPMASEVYENFTTCLILLKDEPIAKEKARQYLDSPDASKVYYNFTTCLALLKDEPIAKEKARQYLDSPDAIKVVPNYATCISVLGEEAKDIVEEILKSDFGQIMHQIVYQALQIAAKVPTLDVAAEKTVLNIFKHKPQYHDSKERAAYNFYLQVMKISLFRLKIWQNEVDKQLFNYRYIHRNLFYSLTLSHIEHPNILKDACLYFIKNWKNEFERPKGKWGYFIRCLAHPVIQETPKLRDEVRSLCGDMLQAKNSPNEIKEWLNSIVVNDIFPQWKRSEKED